MTQLPKQAVLDNLAGKISIPSQTLEHIADVLRIMTRLRAPEGCPWDRAQTHKTLLKNLLEEAYEFVETIDDGDDDEMCSELGDLLMQVVFHAEIARERGAFNIGDVASHLTDKLIRRHAHVFGPKTAANAAEALASWNASKHTENSRNFSLDSVPRGMAALLRARKVQEKASKLGFDWDQVEGPLDKLTEEIGELRSAALSGRTKDIEGELGDLLFAVVNVARFLGVCPETALAQTVNKFQRRFAYVEKCLAERGKTPQDSNLAEMDVYWEEAKKLEC